MEWTTRLRPELTRLYGVEEIHDICFEPIGWGGKGPVVSLGVPECELILINIDGSGEPHATMNRPKKNKRVKYWVSVACELASEQRAFLMFACDTAEQAAKVARWVTNYLPQYRRVALERMYDVYTRSSSRLS